MRTSILLSFCLLAIVSNADARSIIPELDDSGRKGEMARAEKKKAEARFDAMDANKDGKLSLEEVTGKSQYLTDNFPKLDANKDGSLSWEEFLGHDRWPR